MVGTEETRLVVLRGNSASGKSTVAAGLRERFGRNLALVGQDNLRRVVLGEPDQPGAANIGLIDITAATPCPPGFTRSWRGYAVSGVRIGEVAPSTATAGDRCPVSAWMSR